MLSVLLSAVLAGFFVMSATKKTEADAQDDIAPVPPEETGPPAVSEVEASESDVVAATEPEPEAADPQTADPQTADTRTEVSARETGPETGPATGPETGSTPEETLPPRPAPQQGADGPPPQVSVINTAATSNTPAVPPSLIPAETASAEGQVLPTETDTEESPPEGPDVADPPAPPEVVTFTGPDLTAGRVSTLDPGGVGEIDAIRILEGPAFGNVTVNPDNTLAVVLSAPDMLGDIAFSYEVTQTDGTVQVFEAQHSVVAGAQDGGWGQGEFYMLETDADGDVVVETGAEHRPIYVSGSDDALSRSDIAALEGLQTSQITDAWLIDHPDYGGSEDMALDIDAGMGVWHGVTGAGDKESSHWLLFEKGYSYEMDRLIGRGISGEDELHPLHITSWGEGGDAVINSDIMIFQDNTDNLVFSDLRFGKEITSLSGNNILFDNAIFDWKVSVQNATGFTMRNSEQTDMHRDDPLNGGGYFDPHVDRLAGLFAANSDGILLEGNLWDQIAWEDGFSFDGAAADGQAPSKYSHNIYLQNNTTDVTFRDNITMQAASFGALFRGGAVLEDNVFLDNNGAVSMGSGAYGGDDPIGNYTLFTDNVVTAAAYKEALQTGAKSMGIQSQGHQATFLDNIVAHLSDPNDAGDIDGKIYNHGALNDVTGDIHHDNTIVYNWDSSDDLLNNRSSDRNTDGLDRAVLDQTTIQNFAAALLGDPDASIADLGDHLRDHALGDTAAMSDADVIVAYFQEGFGLTAELDIPGETLRFVPDALGDGVRWDNGLNWDTGNALETMDGRNVDLGGNWVNYGGTAHVNKLDFGDGGRLTVGHGKLTVDCPLETGPTGAGLAVHGAGQIWTEGYIGEGTLTLEIDGGRFANTGEMLGSTETTISDGQALLAVDDAMFELDADSSLTLQGSAAQVGFDGTDGGTGVLRMNAGAELTFVADENGFSSIAEMRSGAFDDQDEANVQSGIHLGASVLSIDITALGEAASSFTLMEADEVIGVLSEVHVTGLSDTQDAELVIDYFTDTVSFALLEPGRGSGALHLSSIGDADSAQKSIALWDALTEGQPVYSDLADPDDDAEAAEGDLLFGLAAA